MAKSARPGSPSSATKVRISTAQPPRADQATTRPRDEYEIEENVIRCSARRING